MALPPDVPSPYEVLAEHGDISVYRCDQGCLHLQLGNVNLRLEDDEFQELIAVISAAATRVGPTVTVPPRYGRVQ
jgi:hypothetical protein